MTRSGRFVGLTLERTGRSVRSATLQARRHLRLLAGAFAIGVDLLAVTAAVAEEDHLKGYKIKDLNQVDAPANPYTVTNQFGSETCDLKKPLFFLVQSEKNGGNDPRGGSAGDFVCYRARCTGPLPPVTDTDTQFGLHQLETKKAKLLCLPANNFVCGDGELDPGETCDGDDDTACPSNCQPDCTCPPQACGNNVREGAEECDGTDATACPDECLTSCACATPCPTGLFDDTACTGYSNPVCSTCCDADTACQVYCGAAEAFGCFDNFYNSECAYAANAAGCAAECCQ